MNKKEAVLISAYTGFLLTKDFSDVHSFCQNLLGRPIYTHEFARADVQKEIEEKCKPLILEMIEKEQDLYGRSVDLVPVVRCRDCKFSREKKQREKEIYIEDALICENSEASEDGYMAVMPKHFCSYGERKKHD